MANYLLVYRGGGMPESPEEGAKVQKAWLDWFGVLGDSLVDGGNPISNVKRISGDRSVADATPGETTGYSVIKADSLDQAVKHAKGCPHLDYGGMVDVAETFPAM